MAIAPAGASLHCNCHCGGQGTGRGSTVTQLQIQSSSGLTNGQCLGPVPASLSACIALHACMVAYWRGREEGGGVCDPWKKAGTGTKAAFPPIKSSSAAPNSNRATRRRRRRQSRRHAGCRGDSASTDDAVRDREVFRLQWRFSAREEERTGSVFSNPSHTPLPWFCGHSPPDHSCFMSQGNSRRKKKGQDRRVYCASLLGIGKREGESLHFFCLFTFLVWIVNLP